MRRAAVSDVTSNPFDAVRSACAWVAEHADSVRIDLDRLAHYARELPVEEIRKASTTIFPLGAESPDTVAAFILSLNAINFGSGYFPHLKKREGRSGYRTLEASLLERFQTRGALTAGELRSSTSRSCADLLGQDLESPVVSELMELYAQAWRDLGTLTEDRYGGVLSNIVREAAASAKALVRILLEMPLYRDISVYEGRPVPFLKRAQITVADLASALPNGFGRFDNVDKLTAFADNLVAHVLRVDGVLCYEPDLLTRIEHEELIPAGSKEEIEIRACEVHAVELLCEAIELPPRLLDDWLWARGGQREYKVQPRHRTRSCFY